MCLERNEYIRFQCSAVSEQEYLMAEHNRRNNLSWSGTGNEAVKRHGGSTEGLDIIIFSEKRLSLGAMLL